MKTNIKALALISMGVFLYSRFWNGKLFFYINERFVWLTIFASVGFLLVGMSYRYRSAHSHDHDHDHAGHTHGQVSWWGLGILLSPIVLGLLVPPKPLGAAAMVNRDVSLESLTSAAAANPADVLTKPKQDKNILDWLIEFRSSNDPAVFDGETIQLTGFVYRDDRFDGQTFMISRFVLSCCAADAAPLGLIVAWPESGGLADDQWVEVSGHLQAGEFMGETMPIIIADSVTPTEIPDRPYLYPF